MDYGLKILCIVGLFAIFSSTMSKSPTLPLLSQALKLSPSEIGLVAAASTITGIFANIFFGSVSDVYGRRKILLISGAIFATAPLLYFFARDVYSLALVRIYHGFATAIFTPVSVAVVADLYKEKRGERMGTLSSFTLIGRLLAPLTGGFLIYSYSFEAVFVVCFIAGAIAFFGISRLKIETENIASWSSSSAITILSNLKIVTTNHELLSIGLIQALTYFTMQGIETFFPLYASGLNLDSRSIGMILTVELTTMALLNPFMGKISDKIGRLPTIVLGTVIASLGLASLYILKTPILIVISVIVYATGIVGITTSTYPLASELVGKETYGSAIGAIETIRDVGQALGPILSGIISQVLKSYDVVFVFLVIIMLINIIVSLAVLNAE